MHGIQVPAPCLPITRAANSSLFENNQLLESEEFRAVALGISEINCFGFMLQKTVSFTA